VNFPTRSVFIKSKDGVLNFSRVKYSLHKWREITLC